MMKTHGEKIMSIAYVSRKRLNPRDISAKGKFYPAPAYFGEVNLDMICEKISASTTLTPGDVKNVITSLLLTVPEYMLLGYKVRLDDFGIFKLSFSGKGKEKATQVTADDISGLKVLYTPDLKLKTKLSRPEFTKVDAKYISDDENID